MRKVVLFIATSIDGFIAGPDEEIDWLFTDQDYGYTEFYNSIDTTLMGYKTYKLCESFPEFPYPDKENFVFTRDASRKDTKYVKFVSSDIEGFVSELKAAVGKKDIMLVGGGQINNLLVRADLIDEIVHSIIPVVLGKGIPLFGNEPVIKKFKTAGVKTYDSGLIQMKFLNDNHSSVSKE